MPYLTRPIKAFDNREMKVCVALSALFLSFSLLAQGLSVRFDGLADDQDLLPRATIRTNSHSFTPVTVRPGGDGTASSDGAKVYVPILRGSTVADRRPHLFSVNNSDQILAVPVFRDLEAYNSDLVMPFEVTVPVASGQAHFLYAAVSTSEGWKIVGQRQPSISAGTNRAIVNMSVNFGSFCEPVGVNCSSLLGSGGRLARNTYFFLSREDWALDTEINPNDWPGGVYLSITFSSQTHLTARTTLTNIFRGDSSAVIEYNSNRTLVDIDRVIAVRHPTGSNPEANLPIGSYSLVQVYDRQYLPNASGSLIVFQLENETEHLLSLAMVDRYNFVSPISNALPVSPQQIEEILSREACFIVTAGFGRDHQVIGQFKLFRDQVLLSFALGQKLVDSYYAYSPALALDLLERPRLRALVRTISWTIYGVFHYLGVILIALFSALAIFVIIKFQGVPPHGRPQ
jgi:hypothetical protein